MQNDDQSGTVIDRIDVDEQVDWANDCDQLRQLAASAEAAIRRGECELAHERVGELVAEANAVLEEYPRYIHEGEMEAPDA